MRITYCGSRDGKYARVAIISCGNSEKEQTLFEKVADTIEKEGYKVDCFGSCDSNDCYVYVDDKEDFECVKEIYKNAKKFNVN